MNRFFVLIVLLLLPVFFTSGSAEEAEDGLIELDSVGYLQIQSSVEGARVYLDRAFMGFIQDGLCNVPVDVTVSPQYSNLILEYTGYQTYMGPLPSLVAGKTVGVRVEMNKTGYDRSGIIQFESGLNGTEILLNGESKGFTPDSGILMIHTIPGGLYKLTVRRGGNLTVNSEQYVSSHAITLYRVTLLPASIGEVHINTTPNGAGIYLNNRYEGLSPLTFPDVPVGNISVRITCEGYQDWNGDQMVTGGESNQVDAVLVSLPPTPTPECTSVTSDPDPLSPLNETAPPMPNNLILFAGFVLGVCFIACITLAIRAIRKKKEE